MVVLISISVSVDDRRALFASGEDMGLLVCAFLGACFYLLVAFVGFSGLDPKIHFSDGTPSYSELIGKLKLNEM